MKIRKNMGHAVLALLLLGIKGTTLPAYCANSGSPEVPLSLSTEFLLPKHPFIILSPEEKAAAVAKIKTESWAKAAMQAVLAEADAIVADPNFFPDHEGGWIHQYVDPKTGGKLQFDPKKPTEHYSPDSKTYLTGTNLNNAWNSLSMELTVAQQDTLAMAWLLTGDRKYAEVMKRVYLDMAAKYSGYVLHNKSMKLVGGEADFTSGRATAQSIDECNYFTSLVMSYDALAGSGVLSKEEEESIEAKLWKPLLEYMYRLMAHPAGGNWQIWHACGAVVLGATFGDQELVDKGFNQPKDGLLAMLRAGYVNNDGFTAEFSPGYHLYPFKALMRAAIVGRRVGIDFYQVPQFRKMFELPLKIAYPNLFMPRLNDGGAISLVNKEWAAIYEEAVNWYGTPTYGELLHTIYSAPGSDVKRESRAALLYGPATLPAGAFDNSNASSIFLKATGHAILRSPGTGSDWNCILKNDASQNAGHHHPDALNFILYANGEEAFPGTGSPLYGHPLNEPWFAQTIAHNTITLNSRSQRISWKGKIMEFGLSRGALSAAQSSARWVQGDRVEDAYPTALRRSVVMTPHAIVDIYRVAKDVAEAKSPKVHDLVNQVDWALHMNGNVSLDKPWQASTDLLMSEEQMNAPRDGKFLPHQGYKFLRDLSKPTEPGVIHGTLTQNLGGKVDFWLAASDPGQVYFASGPGLETSVDKEMPTLIQRRTTNETVFTSVYAPYKDKAQVQDVRFLLSSPIGVEVAVEVTHSKGKDLTLSLPTAGTLAAGGASLDGVLGCRTELSDGNQMLLLVGKSWSDEKQELSLEQSGAVVLEAKGSKLQITNSSEQPVEGKIKIKTRNFEKSFRVEAGETADLGA